MKRLRKLYPVLCLLLAVVTVYAQSPAGTATPTSKASVPCKLEEIKESTLPAASDMTAAPIDPSGGESGAAVVVPPKDLPAAIDTLARATANGIVERKTKPLADEKDPNSCSSVPGQWRKIVMFALALGTNPDKASKIEYIGTAQAETQRTDKQVSASTNTTGSSSAVEKSGLPYLLGIALDHGAIDQNIDGSMLNLTSSLYALPAAFKGDTAKTYGQYSEYTRVGISAAYNLQNQNDPLANVTRKNLNEWAVKIRLFGDHSARSADAHRMFLGQLKPVLQQRANAMSGALENVFGNKPRALFQVPKSLRNKLTDYLNSADFKADDAPQKLTDMILQAVKDEVYGRISEYGINAADVQSLSDFLDRYKSSTEAYVNAAKTFDEQIKALAEKPSLTLGYFNERGSGTPAYSVVKLLYEKKPKQFMQIDANVSSSFYGNPDKTKNEQTLRDAAAALGLEQKLGRSPFLTNDSDQSEITMSFSGRYERLQENQHIPGKKADIAVANLKLEIPVAAGISLPLSVTFANATELINEKHVRGNFGITFDLDKLKALAGAK